MAIPDTDPKKDILSVIIYIVVMSVIITGGFYVLTAQNGLSESVDQLRFWLFGIIIVMFSVLAIAVKIGKHIFLKDSDISKSTYFVIHDPELGFFNWTPVVRNAAYLFFASLFFFSFLAFVGSINPQSSLFTLPLSSYQASQETTPLGKLYMSFFNSPAENALIYIIIFILATTFLYLTRKTGINWELSKWLLLLIIPFLTAFFGVQIHTAVSGADAVRNVGHFIFWYLAGFITIGTGSIIPLEVYHLTNNLFDKSRFLFGDSFNILMFGIILSTVFIIASIVIYLRSQRNEVE